MKKAFILLALLALNCDAHAFEGITDFHTGLQLHKDGSLTIVETIKVHSLGKAIKRGIIREIPTLYSGNFGTKFNINFNLQSVTRDGQHEIYHAEPCTNGIRIFIGNKDVLISPGTHTYTLAYSTHRQVGYFSDHDELFINITGNGWRLPILKASFTLHLPFEILPSNLMLAGYTGPTGSSEHACTINQVSPTTITGHTTTALHSYEGFTVAIGWPKGLVDQPSLYSILYNFFKDNLPTILMLFCIALLLLIYCLVWLYNPTREPLTTIIPLFYPPEGLSPAEVAVINSMKISSKSLTASLVNLAVHGFIKIEYTPGSVNTFFRGSYLLHTTPLYTTGSPEALAQCSSYERALMQLLFDNGSKTTCQLQSNEYTTAHIVNAFYTKLEKIIDIYINYRGEVILGCITFSLFSWLGLFLYANISDDYSWFIRGELSYGILMLIALGIINAWGVWPLRAYTPVGRAYQDKILGYKMFLETTKIHSNTVTETPPEQSPQLYEKGLPYAIALGVEERWAKKFEPLFAKMEQRGTPYIPLWYSGYYPHQNIAAFSHQLATSLSSSIPSGKAPGSTSGFKSGGGGGSGGGSGGGGGGGW